MVAVKELLSETLRDENFIWFLQFALFQRSLQQISWRRLLRARWGESLVNVLVETFGQQSVEITTEVLMDMNRADLVPRLSESSSGPKGEETETTVTKKRSMFTTRNHILLFLK